MSPMAVTTAPVCSRKEEVTFSPRPPQPRSPRRTAELAIAPRTSCGLRIITPAPAAVPRNWRRPILPPKSSLIASISFCLLPGEHPIAFRRPPQVPSRALSELPQDLDVAAERDLARGAAEHR